MERIGWIVAPLLLVSQAAFAESAGGGTALALAALIAERSPDLDPASRDLLKKLLNGEDGGPFPAGQTITVTAAAACRAGNVDITFHSCDLTFGSKQVTIRGRAAHELYATLAEAGIPPEGAAGSLLEGVKYLTCTIDPGQVKENAGGGAGCEFQTN